MSLCVTRAAMCEPQCARPAAPIGRSGRLTGKRALVTGAGSGIGRGIALAFAAHGARIFGADLRAAAALETQCVADEQGAPLAGTSAADVTDPRAVRALVDAANECLGGIDVLVTAAATAVFAPIEDLAYEDWQLTLRAELDSVFLCCKAAWPLLKRQGGSIINFASANAYLTLEGSPALAHCAGKGGVLAMTRQLALEGAPHGIRANTISPGMIRTAATAALLMDPAFSETVLRHAMIKRVGAPEDIAWCAIFLASDESAWITAADINVDGGATAL